MRFDITQEMKKRNVQHKRRQRWHKRLSAMAAVVVFCTTYALILPAITMEKEACTLEEHTHVEECYVPFVEESWLELNACSMAAHIHTDECAAEEEHETAPAADLIVHTHEESCYDRAGHLLCTLEELELHEHTDECYEVRTISREPEQDSDEEPLTKEEMAEEGDKLLKSIFQSVLKKMNVATEELPAEEPEVEEPAGEATAETAPPAEEKNVLKKISSDEDDTSEESVAEETASEEPKAEEPAEEKKSSSRKTVKKEYSGEPLCGQEELELHTHSEDCLNENGETVCGKPQVILHTHDEQCLRTVISEPVRVILECGEETAEDAWSGEENQTNQLTKIGSHVHNESCYSYWMYGCGLQEHVHSVDCGAPFEANLELEDNAMLLKLQVFDTEPLPEDLSFELRTMAADETDYVPYADYAAAETPGELRALSAYEIVFFSGGHAIQLPNAEIVAEMTVKELELPAAQDVSPVELGEDSSGEAGAQTYALGEAAVLASEAGQASEEEPAEEDPTAYQMHLTALSTTPGGVSDADSATVEFTEPVEPVMYMSLGSSRTFALARSVEPLPKFEIHYLCNMLRYYTPSDTSMYLKVINTAHTGASRPVSGEPVGGLLPVNGYGSSASPIRDANGNVVNDIYNLYLEPSSTHSGYYRTAMNYELVEVYQAQENVIYSNSMTSKDMNVLRDNDHYGVTHIQTQAAGSTTWVDYQVNDQSKINDTTYEWHDVDKLYYFTNNPNAVKDSQNREPIVITEGMKLRYIYFPTSKNVSFDANFYDYDISDGSHTVSGRVTTMDTKKSGINSQTNYTNGNGSGSANLAFGNSNTGSGWQDDTMDGYTLNQYNRSSYAGLTFGIVTDYDPDTKKLTYDSEIVAPYLFSYNPTGKAVVGKSSYGNTDMEFRRDGDTYTLTRVYGSDGIYDNNLELFEITYNKGSTRLLSNSFWPFDNINDGENGHDIHFGSQNAYNNSYERFSGVRGDGTTSYTGNLPVGDEGLEHNSYFGLEYEVKFHLDGSYTGPLEYLFYGDDDMWVFLTDHQTGETHLIADIGGVHSSVGSYTDLWDWVPDTAERPNGKGDYSLHFFYTERGASGSSCYMQFTIPDAVGVPQQSSETGSVSVEKTLAGGMTTDEDFLFNYEITYPSGLSEAEKDRILPYTIVDSTGTVVSGALFREGQFELKAGQKIIIGNIPVGSNFSVSEEVTDAGNYNAAWTVVPTGATQSGDTVTGTIAKGGQTVAFECTNTYNSLTLMKKLSVEAGIDVADEFTFEVLLTDASGTLLTGNVNTVIQDANGSYSAPVANTLTDGKLTVKLKVDESISFFPLPDGAKYTITETDSGGLLPTWPDGSGNDLHSATVSGTVASGNVFVTCVNRAYYQMPSTGGVGTTLYTMGGLLMMTASGLLGYKLKRKEENASS